ncbi:hypothetical protein EON83_08260 [bacterium]|nr:MAG: hypothetical protein EON83_08260 [bacterium]
MRIIRVLGLAVLGLWAVPTMAQPGSTQGGRPPGGGGMRGGMRSPKMRLPRFVEGAVGLSGANALTKAQAKKMVGLVAPWKTRPTMSEDAGKALFASLTGTLTAAQKTAMEKDRPRFGGQGGPGGPGGRPEGGRGGMGGPGGGGRPEGGRGGMGGPGGPRGGEPPSKAQMDKMRSMMASYNPLYTGTPAALASMPEPMKEGMKRRRDRLNAALSQLQKKAR